MSTDKEKDVINEEGQENEGHPAAGPLTPAPQVSIPSSTTHGDGGTTTAAGVSVEKAAGEPGEKKREYKEMEEEHATTRQK